MSASYLRRTIRRGCRTLATLGLAAGLLGLTAPAASAAGTVVAWGANADKQLDVPPGLSHVVAIAAGAFHSLALKTDGTVITWGDKSHGEAPVPAGLSDVTAIAAGGYYSLALRSNGTV